MTAARRVAYWFRTDLRLHDSPALKAALDLKPDYFYPIWIWDPTYIYHGFKVGPNRWKFLLDSQNDLSKSITKINPKSKLLVIRGEPIPVLQLLLVEWGITDLVFEQDTEKYASSRDKEVKVLAKRLGVNVLDVVGRNLWDPHKILRANNNKPTLSITSLRKAATRLGTIKKPEKAPDYLPDPGPLEINTDKNKLMVKSYPDLNKQFRVGKCTCYDTMTGPKKDFAIVTMEELGMPKVKTFHIGGETEALRLLEDFVKDPKRVAQFAKPDTSPAQFSPQSTSLISPHLHFGTLSVRYVWHKVDEAIKKFKGTSTQPPVSFHGQLLFREMYFCAEAAIENFGQTYGNRYCRYIDWNLCNKYDESGEFIGIDEITGPDDGTQANEWFENWKYGKTGFPWIDALMRQLRQEGWIHHLGRHSVACFLTRGHCYISWERGAEVFQELLLDHEPACNIGNWQWLSCTCFFAQYYRVYSPVAFGQKWDKKGKFIRRYVPELKNYPDKFIYDPWNSPKEAQKNSGCIIGKDYPAPMFDENERRKICLDRMKNAFQQNLHGTDKTVLKGNIEKNSNSFDERKQKKIKMSS